LTKFDPGTCRGIVAGEGEGVKASVKVSFVVVCGNELNLSLVRVGSLLQILGEVEIFKHQPIIVAHILQDMLGLDAEAYYRAVDRVQPFLPVNVQTSSSS